jgi:hypothetical protein
MSRRSWITIGSVLLGILTLAGNQPVQADDQQHSHKHVKSTVATPHTMKQAGYPQEVSIISMESYNQHYRGGLIGGGKGGHGAHTPSLSEGTWGWDYNLFRPLSSRIFLGWTHGRRYQGGSGSYATDGPKPLEHITETIHGHFGIGDD